MREREVHAGEQRRHGERAYDGAVWRRGHAGWVERARRRWHLTRWPLGEERAEIAEQVECQEQHSHRNSRSAKVPACCVEAADGRAASSTRSRSCQSRASELEGARPARCTARSDRWQLVQMGCLGDDLPIPRSRTR